MVARALRSGAGRGAYSLGYTHAIRYADAVEHVHAEPDAHTFANRYGISATAPTVADAHFDAHADADVHADEDADRHPANVDGRPNRHPIADLDRNPDPAGRDASSGDAQVIENTTCDALSEVSRT